MRMGVLLEGRTYPRINPKPPWQKLCEKELYDKIRMFEITNDAKNRTNSRDSVFVPFHFQSITKV